MKGGRVLPAISAFAVIGRPPDGSFVESNKGPMCLILPPAGHKGYNAVPLSPLKQYEAPTLSLIQINFSRM